MKFNFKILLVSALAAMFVGCKDDDNSSSSQQTDSSKVECWKILDGDFQTSQDVVVSADSSSINISNVYAQRLQGDKNIKNGDVIALFNHGILDYFQVNSSQENGEHYKTYKVNKITLEKVLELCNINMDSVQLSTTIYTDSQKPKRVSNSGEADADGIMNTSMYMETAADGSIIYHPMAVAVPVYNEGANAEEDSTAAVEGGFMGCYVGQVESMDAANGFFSAVYNLGKTAIKGVIAPVRSAVQIVNTSAEFLTKIAVGGQMDYNIQPIDIDHQFSDYEISLISGDGANKGKDEDSINYTEKYQYNEQSWTKEDWQAKCKGIATVALTGHLKAAAGCRFNLSMKPGKVEKFKVGSFANVDLDITAKLKLGVQLTSNRTVVLRRFQPKSWFFCIGPVPVLIVIYPELVWSNTFTSKFIAFANWRTQLKCNYDVDVNYLPEYNVSWNKKESPTGDVSVTKLGISGSGDVVSGIYFRTSWQLYGIAGPTFDIGASLEAKGQIDLWKEKLDGPYSPSIFADMSQGIDGKAVIDLSANLGELKGSAGIKFPPLTRVSMWLYKKLSFETSSINFLPPIKKINIYSYDSTKDTIPSNEVNGVRF